MMFEPISVSELDNVVGGNQCPTCGQALPGRGDQGDAPGGMRQPQAQPGGSGDQGDPNAASMAQPQAGGSQCEQILQSIFSLISQYIQSRSGGQPRQ
jgi:hypothetical protein